PLNNVKSTKPLFFCIFPFLTQTTNIMSDLTTAVEWTRRHMTRFQGRVSFPTIIHMIEAEKEDAQRKLKTADDLMTDDLETKDPFLFIFTHQEDMEVFLQNSVDQQHLHVNVRWCTLVSVILKLYFTMICVSVHQCFLF